MADKPITKKNPLGAGRDTKMTPAMVEKLTKYFMQGHTRIEACILAGIHKATLINYCKKNPDFSSLIDELRQKPAAIARNIINSELKKGDKEVAKWYLERKKKDEFSLRQETTGANGGAINHEMEIRVKQEEIRELADQLRDAE